MFDNRALVFVDVKLPIFEPRLVQGLRGERAAVSRGLIGENGEVAAEAPHRHGGALGSSGVLLLHMSGSVFTSSFHPPFPNSLSVTLVQIPGQWGRRKLQVGNE